MIRVKGMGERDEGGGVKEEENSRKGRRGEDG